MKHVLLRVPASSLATARRVAQAFDPDVGGYDSFEPVDEEGLHICSVDVSDEYAQAFLAFKQYPEFLQAQIEFEFVLRFPEAPIPALSDIEAFCEALLIQEV